MLETTVLPIEYDEKTKQQAQELKELLERNQLLFQMFLTGHNKISFLDSDDEETLCIESISDLKDLLSNVIPTYMAMLKKQIYRDNNSDIETVFLRMLLMDAIALKEGNALESEILPEINLNINTIYSVIGMSYLTDDELIDFIFNPTGEVKEKIFKLLNQQERYNLMNMLLEEEYQKMLDLESIENDNYLRSHLEELLELSEIDISERFKKKKEKDNTLPRISQKELDNLCTEFFIQIDPSLKWLKIYNKLKRNNNILYGEIFPDPCSDWGCIETTDNVYMYAPLDGTIRDFMYFIHEFAHCVTLLHKERGEFIPSALQEFPPIFFERLATSFLRDKGYDEEKIFSLEEERINATLSNMSDISPSLRYLTQYIKSGPITYETEKEKMDRIRDTIPDDIPDEMKDLLNNLMSTQDPENVHIKIDAENAFLLEHPNCIFEEYPYILGSDLSDQTLERIEVDPLIIFHMLNITENLTRETTLSVMTKLGLTSVETIDTMKPVKYKKYTKQKNEN